MHVLLIKVFYNFLVDQSFRFVPHVGPLNLFSHTVTVTGSGRTTSIKSIAFPNFHLGTPHVGLSLWVD